MHALLKSIISKNHVTCVNRLLGSLALAMMLVWPTQAHGATSKPISTPQITTEPDFADLSPKHWATVIAKELAVTGAYPTSLLASGRFSPDQPLSRAEALLLVYRSLDVPVIPHYDTDSDGLSDANELAIGTDPTRADTDRDTYSDWHEIQNGYSPNSSLPDRKTVSDVFKDVPVTDWPYPLVYQAYRDELIRGYTDRTFRPEAPITRVELVKIAVALSGLRLAPPGRLGYVDIPPNHWSLPYLATAQQHKLISAEAVSFHPDQPISRAEASKIVYKLRNI